MNYVTWRIPADCSDQVLTQHAVCKMFLVLQATGKHGEAKAHHSLSSTSSESCSTLTGPPGYWSYFKIGQEIGCSDKLSAGGWQDISRPEVSATSKGQLKADAVAQQYICMSAQLPACTSAADVAVQNSVGNGVKEPQQRHKASEEERVAAPRCQC